MIAGFGNRGSSAIYPPVHPPGCTLSGDGRAYGSCGTVVPAPYGLRGERHAGLHVVRAEAEVPRRRPGAELSSNPSLVTMAFSFSQLA